MKTFITLIRHGETEWNKEVRLQGRMDSALTKRGEEQVERVAGALSSRRFDALISSDLGRAIRTTNTINQFHTLDVEFSEHFRERNFGVMEGLTLNEIKERYPRVFTGYISRTADYQIPNGESLVQFSKRVIDGMNVVMEKHSGKRILLVAHGGVLDCVLRMTFDFPLGLARNFSIYNAAINVFSMEEEIWKLEEWGNIDHFSDMDHPLDEFK